MIMISFSGYKVPPCAEVYGFAPNLHVVIAVLPRSGSYPNSCC